MGGIGHAAVTVRGCPVWRPGQGTLAERLVCPAHAPASTRTPASAPAPVPDPDLSLSPSLSLSIVSLISPSLRHEITLSPLRIHIAIGRSVKTPGSGFWLGSAGRASEAHGHAAAARSRWAAAAAWHLRAGPAAHGRAGRDRSFFVRAHRGTSSSAATNPNDQMRCVLYCSTCFKHRYRRQKSSLPVSLIGAFERWKPIQEPYNAHTTTCTREGIFASSLPSVARAYVVMSEYGVCTHTS